MGLFELFLLAVGLSMDAFAVAICAGLTMAKANIKKALIIGLYFGGFQAGMPLIGYFAATLFADMIIEYDHWIAFGLLCFLGGKMIYDSIKKDESLKNKCNDESCNSQTNKKNHILEVEHSLKPATMLPLALATSIDALAIGVSFAFLQVNIIPAVAFIGITTLVISMVGVKIGNVFGQRFKSKAQFAGGAILILIGFKILFEHLNLISI